MKETRKEKVWMIIGVITLLIFGIGATFAYFIAEGGNAEQTNINVTTHTTDSLVFEVGKAISITADQTTFAPGAGNRADNTFARAELKANSSTNNATEHYYVYLSIDTNEFTYSTEEKTAELILTITDPNGNALTNINGLNYVTAGEISGFDITESNGLITIANNYEITSTSTKIDEWNIELTLVNLDANQNNNAGKTFNATLLIQKEEMTLAYFIQSLYKEQGFNNLYYHDKTLVNGAGDNSYRYVGEALISKKYSDIYEQFGQLIRFYNNPRRYCLDYSGECFGDDYKTAFNKAIKDGYIDDINNYICFGSNEDVCPADNLYRIIGSFNEGIKLIKEDVLSNNYVWDESGNNNWETSTLNNFLNSQNGFLGTFPLEWQNKIKEFEWQAGGAYTFDNWNNNDKKNKEVYNDEILNSINKKIVNNKIALMYINDLVYSKTSEYWEDDVFYSYFGSWMISNWQWFEHILSPVIDSTTDIFYLSTIGPLEIIDSNYDATVRPVFYINADVLYVRGSGTWYNPYRIA